LRATLSELPPTSDDMEVQIWLPGSRIYLCGPDGSPAKPFVADGKMMFEGNVMPGSALDD